MVNRAVFLDRDGVINDNKKHVNKPEDLIIYPWVPMSIKYLKKAGYLVFVVTNQGGIEMGHLTEQELKNIHNKLINLLKKEEAYIDEITYCPHFYKKCICRKPKPGMLLNLAKKHEINLRESWMIGDFASDIKAGKAAGCHTIKIGTPHPDADFSCNNLKQAVEYILKHSKATYMINT